MAAVVVVVDVQYVIARPALPNQSRAPLAVAAVRTLQPRAGELVALSAPHPF